LVKSLVGKNVIVTGAAQGIGRACANALTAEGANVIGLDLKPSIADGIEILRCDLSSESEIIDAVAQAVGRLGSVDVLVNNAGILQERPLQDIDTSHIDQMFSVNVRGAILVTRQVLPHLRDSGRIINIVSELAFLGRGNASVYCATKSALLGLTRSWARELAPRILVNAVAPGPTDTPLLDFENLSDAARSAEMANPLARIGRPDEVAASIVFLAGPSATLFTGQCLGANCGAVMQ